MRLATPRRRQSACAEAGDRAIPCQGSAWLGRSFPKFALTGAIAAALMAGGPAAALAPPARMQVSATEFDFGLSRHVLKAGPARIELANFGEDPHDLRLHRIGGTKTYGTRVVAPEDVATLAVKLQAGRYKLWCSLGDHRAQGMDATITVKR